MSVAENYKKIREQLTAICGPNLPTVVAVAKAQPVDKIQEAVDCGITIIGNNYEQEGAELRKLIKGEVQWHFIGHIQRRKARDLLDYDLVQSLDRVEVAIEMSRRLQGIGRVLQVLAEVNIGEEAQKSGVSVSRLGEFIASVSNLPQLRVRGLMAMVPNLKNLEERRPFFERMREEYDKYASKYAFEFLSMGTSDDYLIAAQEGSNMLRLGTALFGPRLN